MSDSDQFGERGQRLYAALTAGVSDEATKVLAEESARTADRLDELDRIIAGKGVLQLLRFRLMDNEGRVAEVKIDNLLGEARQQAGILRQLLTSIAASDSATEPAPGPAKNPLDELRKKREEKQA